MALKGVHVVDGGYLDTGDQIVEHLKTYYRTTVIDHVILTHPDRDHAMVCEKFWSSAQSEISGSTGRGSMQIS
jgi:glyoxylase-like metal-dependent hydrolase (beta-lactamase superfamily II)